MRRVIAIVSAALLALTARAWWCAFDDVYFARRETAPDMMVTGLVAHWRMNDNADNRIVMDAYGGYHGMSVAYTAAKSVTGKINAALDFDGVNDFVTISTGSVLNELGNTSNALTIACWYYSSDGVINDRGLFSKGLDPKMMAFGFVNGGRRLAFICKNGSDGNALWVNTLVDYGVTCASQWVHYAVTYDGSRHTNGVVLYVNGAAVGMHGRFNSLSGIATNPSSFTIGHLYSFDTRAKGRIDDVRVYDRVLLSNEVALIFNAGIGTEDE